MGNIEDELYSIKSAIAWAIAKITHHCTIKGVKADRRKLGARVSPRNRNPTVIDGCIRLYKYAIIALQGGDRMGESMNQGEIIREQTERVERLIFLEDLRAIKNPQPEVVALIEKYEQLAK